MRAETFPALIPDDASLLFSFLYSAISLSSIPKARITRTPERFSRVLLRILSTPDCTLLYIGMVISIIPKTTTERPSMTARKFRPDSRSIEKAIIIAPNTTNGERKSSLNVRLSPV